GWRVGAESKGQGAPAVPGFWLATEDHDLDEVNHAWVFDAENRPIRLQAAAAPGPIQPVGIVRLENNAASDLKAALDGFGFGQEAAEPAAGAYRDGGPFP